MSGPVTGPGTWCTVVNLKHVVIHGLEPLGFVQLGQAGHLVSVMADNQHPVTRAFMQRGRVPGVGCLM